MKTSTWPAMLGFAALGVLAFAVTHGRAGDCVERPFEFTITSVQVIDVQGSSFTVVGTGQATHMGAVTWVNEVKLVGSGARALRTIEAADGDLLVLYAETEFDEDLGLYAGPYEIIGGTGRFEGATGSGTTIQRTGASGTICY